MNARQQATVTVNGRTYCWPKVPAVVICLDGCEPAYLNEAMKAGLVPALQRMAAGGAVRTAP